MFMYFNCLFNEELFIIIKAERVQLKSKIMGVEIYMLIYPMQFIRKNE